MQAGAVDVSPLRAVCRGGGDCHTFVTECPSVAKRFVVTPTMLIDMFESASGVSEDGGVRS
ncbi:hypothetical protein GCM10010315_18230 [Streptomyces luteosporeus]|uniref:Uncharacterized protein n=1 Tax=Streptomyces luteosporeus TaxID=173856 RepID=A0ABN3TNB1_9ACTN